MNWSKDAIRSLILSVVKPLKPGKMVSQVGDQGTMDNLFPDGGSNDSFRVTSPFGFISKMPKGVTGFYQNLFGSGYESILLAFLHKARPEPSNPGEAIIYSTDESGKTIKVKITLQNDGKLLIECPSDINIISQGAVTIQAASKTTVNCDDIELGVGALEKVLNGETFQTFFNEHQHLGNLGVATGAPIMPSIPAHLSNVVKAKK
jgi:phage gp45-like